MPTQTFDFPYHKVRTKYPQSSTAVQLGKSYSFVSKPPGPPQRTFVLNFQGMTCYVNASAPIINTTTNAQRNLNALEAFYQAHELYKMFFYPHPLYGTLNVRFALPFEMPHLIEGGMGVSEPFELQFIEDVA